MKNKFTVHCISWHSGAALLNDVRIAAQSNGHFKRLDIGLDDLDQSSRHALALTDDGKVIGCARITSEWIIDRVVVLQHEGRNKIEAALVEILSDFAFQMGREVQNSHDNLKLHSYPTLLAA